MTRNTVVTPGTHKCDIGVVVSDRNIKGLKLFDEALRILGDNWDHIGTRVTFICVYHFNNNTGGCAFRLLWRMGDADPVVHADDCSTLDLLHSAIRAQTLSKTRIALVSQGRPPSMHDMCRSFLPSLLQQPTPPGGTMVPFSPDAEMQPFQSTESSQSVPIPSGATVFFLSASPKTGPYLDSHMYGVDAAGKVVWTGGYPNCTDQFKHDCVQAGAAYSASSITTLSRGERVIINPQTASSLNILPEADVRFQKIVSGDMVAVSVCGKTLTLSAGDLEKAKLPFKMLNHNLNKAGLSERTIQDLRIQSFVLVLAAYNFTEGDGIEQRLGDIPIQFAVCVDVDGCPRSYASLRLDNINTAMKHGSESNRYAILANINVLPTANGIRLVATPAPGMLSFDPSKIDYNVQGTNQGTNERIAIPEMVKRNKNSTFLQRLTGLQAQMAGVSVRVDTTAQNQKRLATLESKLRVLEDSVTSNKQSMQAALMVNNMSMVSTYAAAAGQAEKKKAALHQEVEAIRKELPPAEVGGAEEQPQTIPQTAEAAIALSESLRAQAASRAHTLIRPADSLEVPPEELDKAFWDSFWRPVGRGEFGYSNTHADLVRSDPHIQKIIRRADLADAAAVRMGGVFLFTQSALYPLNQVHRRRPRYVLDGETLGRAHDREIRILTPKGDEVVEPVVHVDPHVLLKPLPVESPTLCIRALRPLLYTLSLKAGASLVASLVYAGGTLDSFDKKAADEMPQMGAKRGVQFVKADLNRVRCYGGDLPNRMRLLLPANNERGAAGLVTFQVTSLQVQRKGGKMVGVTVVNVDDEVGLKFRPDDAERIVAMTKEQYDLFYTAVCLSNDDRARQYIQNMTSLTTRGVQPLETACTLATAAYFAREQHGLVMDPWAKMAMHACATFDATRPDKFTNSKVFRDAPAAQLLRSGQIIFCALTGGLGDPVAHIRDRFRAPYQARIDLLKVEVQEAQKLLKKLETEKAVLELGDSTSSLSLKDIQDSIKHSRGPPSLVCPACAFGNQRRLLQAEHQFHKASASTGVSFLLGRNCDSKMVGDIGLQTCAEPGCDVIACRSFLVENHCVFHARNIGVPHMQGSQYMLCHICPDKPSAEAKELYNTKWTQTPKEKLTPWLVIFTRPTKYKSNTAFCTQTHPAPALGLMLPVSSTELFLLSLEDLAKLKREDMVELVFNLFSKHMRCEKPEKRDGDADGGGLVVVQCRDGKRTPLRLPLINHKDLKRGVFDLSFNTTKIKGHHKRMAALAFAGVCKCIAADDDAEAAMGRVTLLRLILGLAPGRDIPDGWSLSSLTQTPEYTVAAGIAGPLESVIRHPFLTQLREPRTDSGMNIFTCLEGGTTTTRLAKIGVRIQESSTQLRGARRALYRMTVEHQLVCAGELPVASAAPDSEAYCFKESPLSIVNAAAGGEGADDPDDLSTANRCPICFGTNEGVVLLGPGHVRNIHTDRFCKECADMVLAAFVKKCPMCRAPVTHSTTVA